MYPSGCERPGDSNGRQRKRWLPARHRIRVIAWLTLGVVTGVLLLPRAGLAHERSESFSRWQFDGEVLKMVFTVSGREASRIPQFSDNRPQAQLLRSYLEQRITAQGTDANCRLVRAVAEPAAQGYLRAYFSWACAQLPSALHIGAFFDLAAEHTHFASLHTNGALYQRLLTTEQQQWSLAELGVGDTTGQRVRQSFAAFLGLGFRHILSGLDHLVFLLALVLLCRNLRLLVWAVSGFTLGHSISLSLAALGAVEVQLQPVEATIGLSVALLAAEYGTRQSRSAWPVAALAASSMLALLLAGLALDIPLRPLLFLGLALFALCYLPLAHELPDDGQFRLLITALFGLVHGFGFAGAFALADVGGQTLIWSLAGFNLGVELGQLALIACGLLLGLVFKDRPKLSRPLADGLMAVAAGCGVFWLIQRTLQPAFS